MRGDSGLVDERARSIAARFGDGRPFMVCSPRRRPRRATVRLAWNYVTGRLVLIGVHRLRPAALPAQGEVIQ